MGRRFCRGKDGFDRSEFCGYFAVQIFYGGTSLRNMFLRPYQAYTKGYYGKGMSDRSFADGRTGGAAGRTSIHHGCQAIIFMYGLCGSGSLYKLGGSQEATETKSIYSRIYCIGRYRAYKSQGFI